MPNPIIEVSELYYDMLVKHLPNAYFDLSLEAICNHLDIPTGNKHDALQDAICAAIVFVRLKRGSLPSLSVPSKKGKSLPAHLNHILVIISPFRLKIAIQGFNL